MQCHCYWAMGQKSCGLETELKTTTFDRPEHLMDDFPDQTLER